MGMLMDEAPSEEARAARRRERYQALLNASDPDAVHELIVRYGPEILDQDLPYLIIAARHRAISDYRRATREIPGDEALEAAPAPASSLWDPLERVSQNEALRKLTLALGALPPVDAMIVWLTACGLTAKEIRERLTAVGESMTEVTIRKRLSRARQRLLAELAASRADVREP